MLYTIVNDVSAIVTEDLGGFFFLKSSIRNMDTLVSWLFLHRSLNRFQFH
jgi:hypothetical protein